MAENQVKMLIVTDEEPLAEALDYHLRLYGVTLVRAKNGNAGLAVSQRHRPALAILDARALTPRDIAHFRGIRRGRGTPLVALGDHGHIGHREAASALSADQYVTVPFYPSELLQEIAKVLRRHKSHWPYLPSEIAVGEVVADPERYEVRVSGKAAALPRQQFDALYFLAAHGNRLIPYGDLQNAVYYFREGQNASSRRDSHLRWAVRCLRKLVEVRPDSPRRLLTKHGAGLALVSGGEACRDAFEGCCREGLPLKACQ